MTEFSKAVFSCIAEWGKKAAECDGNAECLDSCAKQLRHCIDAAFPDSKKVEFESDKVNYILSSVFFLANRLSKASQGLAEFDNAMNAGSEDLQKQLDEILAKYF